MSNGEYQGPPSALVAIMNNRADFARATHEHWYRIPVRSAPPRIDFARLSRLAFYQTKVFGSEKWAVNYHAEVRDVDRVKRIELLPQERARRAEGAAPRSRRATGALAALLRASFAAQRDLALLQKLSRAV